MEAQVIARVRRFGVVAIGVLCAAAPWLVGCGMMVDKDRIEVARIGDRVITRGDLKRHLWAMTPEERPTIHNRGDLLRVLESYIDNQLQQSLARNMLDEGQLRIDRDEIARRYDLEHPEMAMSIDAMVEGGIARADAEMQYETIQQQREQGIERMYQQALARAAVVEAITREASAGSLTIDESEYEREFRYQADTLFNPEMVRARGLLFPAELPNSGPKSAEARRELIVEQNWDAVAAKYTQERSAIVFQSQLEMDPQPKFRDFWEQASGAQPGTVIGPIIIQGWEVVTRGADGNPVTRRLPTGYFVGQIAEQRPATPMTLEQAKEVIAPGIYYVKLMKRLREEHGVRVLEDNLWDPALFEEGSEGGMVAA